MDIDIIKTYLLKDVGYLMFGYLMLGYLMLGYLMLGYLMEAKRYFLPGHQMFPTKQSDGVAKVVAVVDGISCTGYLCTVHC